MARCAHVCVRACVCVRALVCVLKLSGGEDFFRAHENSSVVKLKITLCECIMHYTKIIWIPLNILVIIS